MIVKYRNKVGGSDVTNVLNNDHALAAVQYLKDEGYADVWEVVLADDKMLMLDYDDTPVGSAPFLPEQFFRTLGILEQTPGQGRQTYYKASVSKGGNTHVIVHLRSAMDILERIAWQAAFGSDPKREALHLLSVSRGELNPILLFMRKPQTQLLLGDGNATK